MNYIRDLINHLRAGDSERRVARELKVSRPTVHKYKVWAEAQGYLDPAQPLPDTATRCAMAAHGKTASTTVKTQADTLIVPSSRPTPANAHSTRFQKEAAVQSCDYVRVNFGGRRIGELAMTMLMNHGITWPSM